ncbi:hypothetical protein D3C87_1587810 [compost metagenome]
MSAHLELLAALLVDVGGPVNRKLLDAGRKRNGAPDTCSGALRRRHDLARGSVENTMIECLKANADILAVHSTLSLFSVLPIPNVMARVVRLPKADHRFQRSKRTPLPAGAHFQSSGPKAHLKFLCNFLNRQSEAGANRACAPFAMFLCHKQVAIGHLLKKN